MLQKIKRRIAVRLIRALGVDALAGEVAGIAARLAGLSRDIAVTHSIVSRDFIITPLGRFCYFQPKSDATSEGIAGMTVVEAERFVDEKIAARTALSAESVIHTHWDSAPHHNSIHRVMLACLPDVDFVDVGTNIGDTALYVADSMVRLGLPGRVFSFEPGAVFEMARANIWLNRLADRIDLINAAASSHDGYTPMRIMVGNSPSGSIAGIDKHYDIPVGEVRMVQTVKLDTFFASRGQRPLYLKIDAEGHDFAVIRGAANLISSERVPVIHVEISPKYMSEADGRDLAQLGTRYALFNLRTHDAAGSFDRLDLVDSVPDFLARAAHGHGWTDALLVDRTVLNARGFVLLRHLRDGGDAGPAASAVGVDIHAGGSGCAVVAHEP